MRLAEVLLAAYIATAALAALLIAQAPHPIVFAAMFVGWVGGIAFDRLFLRADRA